MSTADEFQTPAAEHYRAGRFAEAEELYRQAISLQPDNADLWNDLGNCLAKLARPDEARAAYEQAIRINSSHAEAHNNLGVWYQRKGLLDEAAALYHRAIALRPDFATAFTNLGNTLRERGDLDGAIACHRKAVELNADAREAANLVYALHMHPAARPEDIFREADRWNTTYALPLRPASIHHDNDPDPDRRLRIGYVSPDFRGHAVGRFLLPLLAHHHHGQFEIVCYSDVRRHDPLTQEFQRHADLWRETRELDDEQLAQQVRHDRIDILVDLTMHMENSRLLTFARKPAPVQATYLAYCSTTGLQTMDYRLTDPYLDPIEQEDRWYSEKSVRLPRTYWCYQPSAGLPAVTPLPALSLGYVTFGCLNTFAKVTPPTWDAWCRLLIQVPRSRLIVHSRLGSHRQNIFHLLESRGIDPRRLAFVKKLPTLAYFQQYQQIDIALDPFPYTGGTTTCDALWMGVPVVSIAGQTAVSRGGLSILSNIRLPELVARSAEQYVQIAAGLAADLPRLMQLRQTMRARMLQSPLMDAPAFARDVESAFRTIWKSWCMSQRSDAAAADGA